MGNQISWHVVLAIKQDQLDDFQALTREMVEFTRTESGVLSYQRLVAVASVKSVYQSQWWMAGFAAHRQVIAD
jgi:quinol monooxygenase YgiN